MHGPPVYLTRLVAVIDALETDEAIVQWAQVLGEALHLPLTVVTVVAPGAEAGDAAVGVVASDRLALLQSDVRLSRLAVDSQVVVGAPHVALPDLGQQDPRAILMLAGRGGQAWSLSEWSVFPVLRAMTTPYLFIPAGAPVPRQVHRVVVGNDGSDLAEAVLRTAQAVGHSLNVDVIAVEAIEPGTIDSAAFRRWKPTITGRLVRARGQASQLLLATARARDASIIVIGAHGLGQTMSDVAGSTARWLLEHSDRPVLVVPQGARD